LPDVGSPVLIGCPIWALAPQVPGGDTERRINEMQAQLEKQDGVLKLAEAERKMALAEAETAKLRAAANEPQHPPKSKACTVQ